MAIPTIKLTVRTTGQNGLDIPNARITARLTTPVVYQGYVMPKRTTAETNGTGVAVLELWPNELGTTMSQYEVKIQDITTGKAFTVYAFVPNRDCNLWEITDFVTGLVLPDGVIGVPGAAATIRVGETVTLAPNQNANVTNIGNFNHAVLHFEIPRGRDGLDGTGTMVVGAVATLPPGSEATVVNVGTDDRAVLNFGIPKGDPGLPGGSAGGASVIGVPAGGLDGQVLTKNGNLDYAAVWRTPASGGGTGGVVAQEIYISLLPWEEGTTPAPSFTPLLDGSSQVEYAAAIFSALAGSKRLAGANALIGIFGTARRLTIRRDGVTVMSLDYTGAMPLYNSGGQIGVSLGTVSTVSAIAAADIDAGTWTATLAGGTNLARSIVLTVGPAGSGKMLILDADTGPGMGINPSFVLVAPRSIDGLS